MTSQGLALLLSHKLPADWQPDETPQDPEEGTPAASLRLGPHTLKVYKLQDGRATGIAVYPQTALPRVYTNPAGLVAELLSVARMLVAAARAKGEEIGEVPGWAEMPASGQRT